MKGFGGVKIRLRRIVGKKTKIVGFANLFAHQKTWAFYVGTR